MQQLNKDNFDKFVGNGLTLLDFWATWCGPCQALAPVVEELATEYSGKLEIGKVDVDEQPDIAAKFEVMSIPTVILMKDGKEVKRLIGFSGKQKIVDAVNEVLVQAA